VTVFGFTDRAIARTLNSQPWANCQKADDGTNEQTNAASVRPLVLLRFMAFRSGCGLPPCDCAALYPTRCDAMMHTERLIATYTHNTDAMCTCKSRHLLEPPEELVSHAHHSFCDDVATMTLTDRQHRLPCAKKHPETGRRERLGRLLSLMHHRSPPPPHLTSPHILHMFQQPSERVPDGRASFFSHAFSF